MRARWWNGAACLTLGFLAGVACAVAGEPRGGVGVLVVLAGAAWWVSPLRRRGRGTSHWDAQQGHVRDDSLIVYWRPGCPRCALLRLHLARAPAAASAVDWVDVWADAAGLAFVRDVNDGAGRVPTVILRDGSSLTRPDPATVLADLAVREPRGTFVA